LLSVAVIGLAACASTMAPGSMEDGKFTSFDCDGGDFHARWNAASNTVRVRSNYGAAELPAKAKDVFTGDGYELQLAGKDGVSLSRERRTVRAPDYPDGRS
jgi:hypothetical protein